MMHSNEYPQIQYSAYQIIPFSVIILGLSSAILFSCNNHKVEPLDQLLNASNRIENRLPAKTKLDFLFVIDDSSSMGEEQKALAENFKTFSDFLFDELQGAADYRIAVTNSGVENISANCTADKAANGAFVYQPANPGAVVSWPDVLINGEEPESRPGVFPDTSDCDENSNPVISSEELTLRPVNMLPAAPAGHPDCGNPESAACIKIRRKLLLEKEFRCHSTIGTQGCVIEKGLEAMRLALSCSGPNAPMFKSCCVGYNENDPNQNQRSFYNPACVIGPNDEEPSFLRPDATLVIIFISDENDCSTPVDNPYASSRFICQPGWNLDDNNDNVPDIYEELCGLEPAECFQRECGSFASEGAEACHNKRCDVERYQDLGCEYNRRQALVPVNEYRDFLLKLKARPLDQILVATIVGFRQYLRDELGELVLDQTNDPYELVYNPGFTADNCKSSASPNVYTPECCPNGVCQVDDIKHSCNVSQPRRVDCAALGGDSAECQNFCGDEAMSCDLVVIDQNIATPGSRYLDLAESLGANGLGCDRGNEPIIDELTGVIEERGECVNICADDFIKPLRAIKERVADLLNTYCVNRLPACYVPEPDGLSVRACEGEDFSNPAHYKAGIRVSRQCLVTTDQGGNCEVVEPLFTLPNNEWRFSLGTEGCAGVIELLSIPPAGSEIFIDYVVTAGTSTLDGEQTIEVDTPPM
jgi:hypothetical protein